jgi:protein-S-isoprenylcysteine O-methyltransferase Ste14
VRILNRICQLVYELALVGALLLAIFASIHGHFTQHFSVVQTIDDSHAKIAGNFSNVEVGKKVNIYRFNYDWKPKIGAATIDSKSDDQAVISLDPAALAWPLGTHGQITQEKDVYYVSIGARLGLKNGDMLNVFENREKIGRVRISAVEAERSTISKTGFLSSKSLDSLVASNFSVATQATYFQNKILSVLEILITLGLALIYFLVFFISKKSPFILLGELLKKIPIPKALIFWLVNILVAIPFVWFMSKMPLNLLIYIWKNVFEQSLPGSYTSVILPFLYVGIGLWYFYFLFRKQQSPILVFWRKISYKKPREIKNLTNKKSFSRGLFLWTVYLVVIYAFASTLTGFLKADLSAMNSIGWNNDSLEATFEYLKYGIWSLTIVGCLIGYGHSVVSILWKKYVNNLDFTVQGWLTNGFCYPLFGVVIWQMIPSFTGIDPIITEGPLQALMLFMGLLLNVLYMLSIWNLGTMFGVMADKGVRTWGFYSVVRHPSYTLEVLMFFVTELMGLTTGIQWLGISMYFFLYWIRSEREDNFMRYSNPKFIPYAEKTPYKFIPGIY